MWRARQRDVLRAAVWLVALLFVIGAAGAVRARDRRAQVQLRRAQTTPQTGPYARGRRLFAERCVQCHAVGWKQEAARRQRPRRGPDLTRVLERRPREQVAAWVRDAHAVKPDTGCRARVGRADDVRVILFFLERRRRPKPERARRRLAREWLGRPALSTRPADAGGGPATSRSGPAPRRPAQGGGR
jgi:mono/diheme cytochrome c family protein